MYRGILYTYVHLHVPHASDIIEVFLKIRMRPNKTRFWVEINIFCLAIVS